MESSVHDLVSRIYEVYLKRTSETDLDVLFREELETVDLPVFYAELFFYRISSIPRSILDRLKTVILRTNLEDIVRAFQRMQHKTDVIYEFAPWAQEVFGVDFRRLVLEDQIAGPSPYGTLWLNLPPQTSGPSNWTKGWLHDMGINQDDLIEKMRNQGAPIIESTAGELVLDDVYPKRTIIQSAVVTFCENKFYLEACGRTECKSWMRIGEVTVLELPMTDAEIGAAILKILGESKIGASAPTDKDSQRKAVAAAGFTSWVAFAKLSKLVDIELSDIGIGFLPLRWGGIISGYTVMTEKEILLNTSDPAELGAALSAAIDLCE